MWCVCKVAERVCVCMCVCVCACAVRQGAVRAVRMEKVGQNVFFFLFIPSTFFSTLTTLVVRPPLHPLALPLHHLPKVGP